MTRVLWALGVLLSLFAASTVWYASNELAARRGHRAESVQHQLAIAERVPMIIDGQQSDISEYRSRILVPFTLLGIKRLGILGTDEHRYMVIRLVTGAAMFLTVWWLLLDELQVSLPLALTVTGWLAVWLVASFNIPWEVPTDYLDIIGLSVAITLVRRRKRLALTALVLVATLNRESSAYYGLLLFWLAALDRQRRLSDVVWAIGLSGLAVVEMVTLRVVNRLPFGDLHNHSMIATNIDHLVADIRALPTPGFIVPLGCGLGALATWLWMRRGSAAHEDRAWVCTAATIVMLNWCVTSIGEIRVYLPTVFLLLLASIVREQRATLSGDQRVLPRSEAGDVWSTAFSTR